MAKKKTEDKDAVFRFRGIVEALDTTFGESAIIRFPYDAEKIFGTRASVRVLGTINGVEVDRALIPAGDGSHYLVLSRPLRKSCKVDTGDEPEVVIRRNPNPEDISIPEELQAIFDQEEAVKEKWDSFLPGMRRNICYWVDSAKRPETRAKRAVEVMRRILSGEFRFGGKEA